MEPLNKSRLTIGNETWNKNDERLRIKGKIRTKMKNKTKQTPIEDIVRKLTSVATGVRGEPEDGFTVSHEILYQNPESRIVVLKALTDNADFLQKKGRGQHIVWGQFFAGNGEGYTSSEVYVASEARFGLKDVYEDQTEVIIPRSGTRTAQFGIKIAVSNITFPKDQFKPYN
jgi:hypothetical protein